MNIQTLRTLMKIRNKNQSALAKSLGISRQAVSFWFQTGQVDINIHSKHLFQISDVLCVGMDDLFQSLPLLADHSLLEKETTKLLWDKLYPSLIDFIRALLIGQSAAISRLVEVYGLFDSSKILGKVVWRKFPIYKKLIHPKRREELENLWNLQKSLELI